MLMLDSQHFRRSFYYAVVYSDLRIQGKLCIAYDLIGNGCNGF